MLSDFKDKMQNWEGKSVSKSLFREKRNVVCQRLSQLNVSHVPNDFRFYQAVIDKISIFQEIAQNITYL